MIYSGWPRAGKSQHGSINVVLAVEVLHPVGCQELLPTVGQEQPEPEQKSRLAEFIRHQPAIRTIYRQAQLEYKYMKIKELVDEPLREMVSTIASKSTHKANPFRIRTLVRFWAQTGLARLVRACLEWNSLSVMIPCLPGLISLKLPLLMTILL